MTERYESEADRVAARLRDDILDGVRPPGSKLVERDLAEQLGVSRVPVRDALRTLIGEGLVTPRPRSWAVVREFTPSDLADLDEVRSALEVLAFKLVAERRTREGLARLRAALEAELEAAARGDAVEARRAGGDFHEIATELAGNELLAELGGTLSSRMRWALSQHDDLAAIAEEHRELYRAIERRDATAAVELAEAHLATSRALSRRRTGGASGDDRAAGAREG